NRICMAQEEAEEFGEKFAKAVSGVPAFKGDSHMPRLLYQFGHHYFLLLEKIQEGAGPDLIMHNSAVVASAAALVADNARSLDADTSFRDIMHGLYENARDVLKGTPSRSISRSR